MATRRTLLTAVAVLICGAGLVGSPARAADPPPIKQPRAGCATFTDPAGDSVAPGGNDPDLDITRVVLQSLPGKLRAFLFVDELGSPALLGHVYEVGFLVGGKKLLITGGEDIPGVDTVHRTTAPTIGKPLTNVTWDAAAVPDAVLDVVFDTENSVVVLTADRAPIDAFTKAPLVDGTRLTEVSAASWSDAYTSLIAGDNAPKAIAPAQSTFTLGVNPCFTPPKGILTLTSPATAVFGHPFTVIGALTDEAKKAIGDKKVVLSGGGLDVEATTTATGELSFPVPGTLAGGDYDLTATWAGDDSLQKAVAVAHTTVGAAPSSLALTSAVSGKQVAVKTQLLSDLKQAIAAQTITWYVDGKSVRTTRTDASGRTSFTTGPKHTVKASYGGWAGHYLASTASKRI